MTGPRTSPTAPPPDWDAIARYLAGESSASEAAAVRQWLDAHPTDARAIAALDAAVARHAPRQQVDVEAALRKVKTRQTSAHWTERPLTWGGFVAAAASVLFLVFSMRDRPLIDSAANAPATYSTTVGADTVRLADGTRVILGPASSISVNQFAVALTGEAFFSIAERSSYVVVANHTIIRDIGTEFGVRAYPNEPVRVVVTSGIVELSRPEWKVTLDSGDVGVVEPNGLVTRTADAVTADDVAWMQGRLVFRNASMATMRADLQRWYGVELRVMDTALLRRHFTGSFSGEPVDRIGDVIALALGARADRRGDTLYIRARR